MIKVDNRLNRNAYICGNHTHNYMQNVWKYARAGVNIFYFLNIFVIRELSQLFNIKKIIAKFVRNSNIIFSLIKYDCFSAWKWTRLQLFLHSLIDLVFTAYRPFMCYLKLKYVLDCNLFLINFPLITLG